MRNWRKIHPLIALQFLTLYVVTTTYPLLLVRSIILGTFFGLMMKKLIAFLIIGCYYRFCVRSLPEKERVSPLAALALIPVLPVVYGLLAPLAFFTLDSAAWCTRLNPDALPVHALAAGQASQARAKGRLKPFTRKAGRGPRVRLEQIQRGIVRVYRVAGVVTLALLLFALAAFFAIRTFNYSTAGGLPH